MENWNLLQIRLTVCLLAQRTRKRENVVDKYYSKKSRVMPSSYPLSDDIPRRSKPFSPVNGLGIINLTSKTQQIGEIILPVRCSKARSKWQLDDLVPSNLI